MKPRTFFLTIAILFSAVLTSSADAQTAAQRSTDEYKRGRAYLEARDYVRAVEQFQKSIAIRPSGAAYMDMGISYHRMKLYEQALSSFKEVARMAPNNADVHYWMASTYQSIAVDRFTTTKKKDLASYQLAETEARIAVRLRPNYHGAYLVLTNSLYVQEKYEEAVAAGEQALRTEQDDATIYILALSYARVGRRDQAAYLYESLAFRDPKLAADLLAKLNNIKSPGTTVGSGSGSTSGGSDTRPNSNTTARAGSAEYYFNEGYKYQQANNYTQAISSYKRSLALNPSLPDTHFNLGYCYYLSNQKALALPAFQQAVQLKPSDSSRHFWLGATYHRLKRYQQAMASLQESLRLKPDEATSHHWLGDVYAEGFQQYEKAIPEYQEAIRLDPKYAIPRNQLGLALTEVDELEAALAAFQAALQIKPNEPLYLSNIGYTYMYLGRREDAVAVQRRLQTLDAAKAKELGDSIEANFPADKDNVEFLSVLGMVVRDRPATSLMIYRRALLLSTQPDDKAAALRGMAYAYKAKNNERKANATYQQALNIYQRLVRLKPNEGYLLYGLGMCYVGLGQKEQAVPVHKRLQAVAPKLAKDFLEEMNSQK